MKNSKKTIWYALLIIVLIVGLIGVYNQIVQGHSVTGISKEIPWGVYVAAFTFFIGISTGSTLIGFIIHVFKLENLKPLEYRAVALGLVTLIGAIFFVMLDVGNPIRMMKVPFLMRNTTSVFFYSSLSYYAFGLLLLLLFLALTKLKKNPENEKLQKRVRIMSIIAFPMAMGIVLVPDGALFSFVKAREFWNRPLLLPHFANAALVSALAVIVIIGFISKRIQKTEILNQSARHLLRIVLIFLVAGVLFLDLFDILVLKYSEKPEGIEAWHLLTTDHLYLFILNLGGLLVALLLLLSNFGKKLSGMLLASILIVFAISAYRYNLIIVGQEIPLLEGVEVIKYRITSTEVAICAGITSLIILAYQIVVDKFEPSNPALSK
jgi:molybdopterin-containing oxidoreductase family membrane subunit